MGSWYPCPLGNSVGNFYKSLAFALDPIKQTSNFEAWIKLETLNFGKFSYMSTKLQYRLSLFLKCLAIIKKLSLFMIGLIQFIAV